MSYQVLARKWRPSTFEEMVGQAHVLRALVNALDQERLHHAYLFTGTRGVGKTTIARLLAKSLNCDEGVSSKPCGVCSSCSEIAEGRFVDLIEVDAASRTKVEDTRELLENVQYAPTRGRFKVYLIDEVHMLSTSSFNALLKTLEEPPPHVKFLLATTDPQKLPVTVLSRCLQFNLKNMSREHIVSHLTHILEVEKVPHDEASLWGIAEGAQGSMRDALSLTDQAIAFGQGELREQEVASMLGTVDLKRVLKLTHALFAKSIDQLMALIAEIDEHTPDYAALMTELMSTLHRVAIAQAAPNAIDNHKGDKAAIIQLAKAAHAEDVHLYYQIAAKAKPDMSLAPSERAGFEMAVLRMLAFSQTPAAELDALPELVSEPAQIEVSPAPKLPVADPETLGNQQHHSETEIRGPKATSEVAAIEQPVVREADSNQQPSSPPVKAERAEPTVTASAALDVPASAVELPNSQLINRPIKQLEAEPVLANHEVDNSIPFEIDDEEPVPSPTPLPTPESEPAAVESVKDNSAHVQSASALAVDAEPVHVPIPEPESTIDTVPLANVVSKNVPFESRPNAIPQPEQGDAELGDLPSQATWPDTNLQTDPIFWWQVTLHRLGLAGMTKTLFAHSQWQSFDGQTLHLNISPNYKKIMNDNHIDRFMQVISPWLPGCQLLKFDFAHVEQTPQLWVEQVVQKARNQAFAYLQEDEFIQTLIKDFEAELIRESANPNHNPIPTGA